MCGLTIAFAMALVSQADVKPDVKYDKFTDRTRVGLDLGYVPDDDKDAYFTKQVYARYEGKPPRACDPTFKITFRFARTGWKQKYDVAHDIHMMIGDEHIPLTEPEYDSSPDTDEKNVSTGKTYESLRADITLGTMKKFLAKDKDWEIKLGIEEPFTLDRRQRSKLKTLVSYLEQRKD